MNVVIIEDEQLSAERLKTLLENIDDDMRVLAVLDSVKTAVLWFRQNEKPDLVFMDIQLADGLSFDIFDKIRIEYPVIFITAYQEYAIRAFKVNSVDYLLKPVAEEDLRSAISKYQNFYKQEQATPVIEKEMLLSIKQMISNPYKSRFMVKVGDRIKSVDVTDIPYFFSLEKGTYLHTSDGRNYVIDYSLDALGDLLDPSLFFRINRRYIITHRSIVEMITLSGSKLKVQLINSKDENVYISRDRLPSFKAWLDA
jgi:DNA-binding LytR/AlgR family response regulator